MTLIVVSSVSRDFILAAGDRSIAYLKEGEPLSEARQDPEPPPYGPKVRQVSVGALVCTAGCAVSSEYIHALLAQSVKRPDPVDVCVAKLVKAWVKLRREPVPYWTFPDGSTRMRDPIFPFGAQLTGFRADGTAHTLLLRRDEGIDSHAQDHEEALFTLAFPLHATAKEVKELSNIDRRTLTFRQAFAHTIHVHRTFRSAYPELVSETLDITCLRWLGEGIQPAAMRMSIGPDFPDPIDFMLDATRAALEQPPADPLVAELVA